MDERMSLEQARKYFEAEATYRRMNIVRRPSGKYHRIHTQNAWEIFQTNRLATPAQTVDVESIKQTIDGMRVVARLTRDDMTRDTFNSAANELARAIGDGKRIVTLKKRAMSAESRGSEE